VIYQCKIIVTEVFTPPFYLRNASIQTLLAGSGIRKRGKNPMLDAAQEVTLYPIDDVRLQGFYSRQTNGQPKGLVMLLHGWEGSVNSGYILSTGRFLYNNGFSIFRLNYRDHGDTHHLNPGLFYAVLLDEVFHAVRQVSENESKLPFFLVGFSMGGNFALRIARKCVENPIDTLSRVISISPVLDPEKSTYAIDRVFLLRRYFLKKWQRSLRKKQACFPDLYEFGEALSLNSISAMTDWMLAHYSDYELASDYFSHYAVINDALADVEIPTTIITAEDDPIIPVDDFYNLKLNSRTELILHRYGGHNGFLETISGKAWYERKMIDIIRSKV
jgi:predicted alpha/beta-fold hydrolase